MSNQHQPSLVGGHAEYIKGAAESVVGTVTGDEAWKQSAAADKKAGVEEMREASSKRDPHKDGYGKAEELAGKAVGCEGMEKEGAESKTQ